MGRRAKRRTVESVTAICINEVSAMFKAGGAHLPEILPLAFGGVTWHLQVIRTACNYGGSRPWLVCPNCERRSGKLYVVGCEPFCRLCHDLTYQSAQSRREMDKAFAMVARRAAREARHKREMERISQQKRKQYTYRGRTIRRLAKIDELSDFEMSAQARQMMLIEAMQ